MDVKECQTQRIVIAKPVASRPSSSCCSTSFRSFSDLLAGAINASSPSSETAVRPKTVRFDTCSPSSTALISSQGEISGYEADGKPKTVVYKPLAKLVSKATVALLASMGNFDNDNSINDKSLKVMQPQVKPESRQTNMIPFPSRGGETESEPLNAKSAASVGNLYDGYNWRKYGQKQVKGSEYPRSYYKCTHPSCPVKKKVERCFDGQIAEIVYKGEHNHSKKPQPGKRSSGSSQGRAEQPSQSQNQDREGVAVGVMSSSSMHSLDDNNNNDEDDCCGVGGVSVEAEEDEPTTTTTSSKRRKLESNQSSDAIQDGRVATMQQNSSDPEASSDGFRWRKYGQKVVKGSQYPRSYYRCTSSKCKVRKHVERASDDPKAFITTYEGKHNHDMPPPPLIQITSSNT